MRALFAFALILLTPVPSVSQENPDAKVLHMEPHGDWEAWCVKRTAEPKPDCFVANAIVYSPRPNFAAMVLYFRPPGLMRATAEVRFGMEAQSVLAPGHFKIDGQDALSATDCILPGTCTLSGAAADALIGRLTAGAAVDWRHLDYGVKPVDIEMDLTGFAAAFAEVKALTAKLALD